MTAPPSPIDDSPPGSWRAELARREGQPTRCAACGQSVCSHPDAIYQGIVPLPEQESAP